LILKMRRIGASEGPKSKEVCMKLNRRSVKVFKIRNRKGYAAVYANNLTEGKHPDQAFARMEKAVCRKGKK
jgi:hypothetical protein